MILSNRLSMIIFAGPSLNQVSVAHIETMGHDLRQPVRRGDVRACLMESDPTTIVIVDGVFHHFLAVGHEELIDAIAAGWEVWGLSSMGAIRAFELRDFGMSGYGQVFHRFFEHEDFQDDELALLHGPEYPYQAFTEPLVHFRVCVEHLVSEGALATGTGQAIIDRMKNMYYGERTLDAFSALLKGRLPEADDVIRNFNRYRVKQQDLVDFLQYKHAKRAKDV